MERDQKHLKTYKSFLLEAFQEVSSTCHTLNNKKYQFDSCLNHFTRPAFTIQKPHTMSLNVKEKVELRGALFIKYLSFLFGESSDSATINKMKQKIHILKVNQLTQQEQIKKYELLNSTMVETVEN